MPCVPIKVDGTTVLANVKPGETLTDKDKKIIADYVAFCRRRSAKKKAKTRERLKGNDEH